MPADILQIWHDFIAALNGEGRAAALTRAFAADAKVRRYGYHGTRDEIIEEFCGLAELQAWLDRTPPTIAFDLCPHTLQGAGQGPWSVRYRLTAPDDFVGGGLWIGHLGQDGKLTALEHRPDDLDPKYGDAVAEHRHADHGHDAHGHPHA